jgi:hypothetical protein
MYVFGRNTSAPHSPLGQLAKECTNAPEDSLQAIGWNLLADHRVSEERAEHFFDVTGKPSTVEELARASVDYHRDWVCQRPNLTFAVAGTRSFVFNEPIP